MDVGVLNYFSNQPAALSYLNGQFILRKGHSQQIEKMGKSVKNFQNSGVTKRFMKVPTKLLPNDKYNSEQELSRATKVLSGTWDRKIQK